MYYPATNISPVALRADPHDNPSRSRSLAPRRDIPLHHPPADPRGAPARASGAEDRDAQGPVGTQRRPAVVRGGPCATPTVATGQEGERGSWEETGRRGGAEGQGAEAAQGGAQVQRREAGDGGCAEGEGVAAAVGEGLRKKRKIDTK